MAVSIFVDSSFVVAISINKDVNFKKAINLAKSLSDFVLYSNNLVKYETINVIARKWGAKYCQPAHDFFTNINTIDISDSIWQQAYKNFIRNYTASGPNLFDYIHFTSMTKYKIENVLSYDIHFKKKGFNLLT